MSLQITHSFVSLKSDGADPSLVQPSSWNADHVLAQTTGTILGAVAGGSGETIELPMSFDASGNPSFETTGYVRLALGTTGQRPVTPAAGMTRYNSDLIVPEYYDTDWRAFASRDWVLANSPTGWSTGDGKITLKTAADAGWVLLNDGTLSNAGGGGTTRANADCTDLYTLLWTNFSDAICPVTTGRGVSAASDFAALKAIKFPLQLGRALAVAGAGAGLTARTLGLWVGAETHNHTGVTGNNSGSQAGGQGFSPGAPDPHTHTIPSDTLMQPTNFWNVMVKL